MLLMGGPSALGVKHREESREVAMPCAGTPTLVDHHHVRPIASRTTTQPCPLWTFPQRLEAAAREPNMRTAQAGKNKKRPASFARESHGTHLLLRERWLALCSRAVLRYLLAAAAEDLQPLSQGLSGTSSRGAVASKPSLASPRSP